VVLEVAVVLLPERGGGAKAGRGMMMMIMMPSLPQMSDEGGGKRGRIESI